MKDKAFLVIIRESICEQYKTKPTDTGGSFGEILCHEMHINHLTFKGLASKWGVSVLTVGELIYDHCKRLEPMPKVNHNDES